MFFCLGQFWVKVKLWGSHILEFAWDGFNCKYCIHSRTAVFAVDLPKIGQNCYWINDKRCWAPIGIHIMCSERNKMSSINGFRARIMLFVETGLLWERCNTMVQTLVWTTFKAQVKALWSSFIERGPEFLKLLDLKQLW